MLTLTVTLAWQADGTMQVRLHAPPQLCRRSEFEAMQHVMASIENNFGKKCAANLHAGVLAVPVNHCPERS